MKAEPTTKDSGYFTLGLVLLLLAPPMLWLTLDGQVAFVCGTPWLGELPTALSFLVWWVYVVSLGIIRPRATQVHTTITTPGGKVEM